MEMTRLTSPLRTQRGTSLLEVLVTIVILAIGLLGLAGLQARMQGSEMEAYQRAQALVLLNDMASRIATNRNNAASYVTGSGSPLGMGMACPTGTSTQLIDAGQWCSALQGAAEETSGGGNVGAMIGGRGCVEALGNGEYLVTVAWQGITPISAPVPACGQNQYNGAAGSACTDDLCRRVITTVIRIGNLT
jgi:type IV pilus assembly protein PilV